MHLKISFHVILFSRKMTSKDDLEVEYEAAVLDLKKEDLANDLFNSDITIWLTYALGELSKYEAWLKEKSMGNTKNMNYVSKVIKKSSDQTDLL